MSLITKIRDFYSKVESAPTAELKHTWTFGGTGVPFNSGNWVDSDRPGNRYSNWYAHGGSLDYAGVGPLYANSAYMACLRSFMDAFSQAPACIKEMQSDGSKQIIPDHPLMEVIEMMNEDEDSVTTLDATIIDYIGPGDAYWLPVFDFAGNPKELHYIPSRFVKPITPADRNKQPKPGDPRIIEYEFNDGRNKPQVIPKEDLIRIRLGMNPDAPQYGLGRGAQLIREIFTDNEATAYTGTTLANMGIPQRIIQPRTYKEGDVEKIAPFDAVQITRMLAQASAGMNRGKTVGIESLFDIHESDASPEKMALDVIRRHPESRVSAVTGVPAMVAGLLSGEGTRTYSNYEEAREAFWQDSVLPLMRRMRLQITKQLIWRNKKYQARKIWFGFNYDEVPALQVDEQARDKNIRENFKYQLIDAEEARSQMGLDPKDGDEGRMYVATAVKPGDEPEEETKSYNPLARIMAEIEELDKLNGHHEELTEVEL